MSETSGESAHQADLVYWWAPRGDERVFDLDGWPDEALALARSLVEEDGLEHSWEGNALVVAAARRDDAAALLDEVVAASQPRLDSDADRTAYDLSGWPDFELEQLRAALDGAEVLFEWTGEDELLVYEADEALVDELFERLDLRGPDTGVQLEGEALTELLTTLFMAADRLESDQDDTNAILAAHGASLEVETLAVPYGIAADTWDALVEEARLLRQLIEHEADRDADDAGIAPAPSPVADAEPADQDGPGEDAATSVAAEDAAPGEGADPALQDTPDDAASGRAPEIAVGYGDEALAAVAASLRDRLKRIL